MESKEGENSMIKSQVIMIGRKAFILDVTE